MVRRRTAVSIAAAALLLASPALTACGSGPAQPGAAAVVGDQRITVSRSRRRSTRCARRRPKSPQAPQLSRRAASCRRQTLSMLVQNDRCIDKAASDAGVTVSDAEVQQRARGRAAAVRR